MDILEFFRSKTIQTNLNAVEWHKDSGVAAIYSPLVKEDLDFIGSQLNQTLPDLFQKFLLQTNGLFYKKLTLYGLPVRGSTKMDRTRLRPQSILIANQSWRLKYEMDSDQFMIGSKSGWTENTGVFLSREGVLTGSNSQGNTKIESFEHLFEWGQDA